MSYVDVFISHGQRDTEKAVALKGRILGWGFSCYVDADDPELAQKSGQSVAQDRALAERIRGKLRDCRCIIYAYSTLSLQSRWMPWELGFFDGRWGPRQIGLYDLDEGRAAADEPGKEGEARPAGVLEYLHIYEELRPDTLQGFVRAACSTRALADRADVDVDRLATLLTAMSRDPLGFTMDAFAYMVTLQQQFWSRFPAGLPGTPLAAVAPPDALWGVMMKASEGFRDFLQPLAQAMKPPAGMQRRSEAMTAALREDGEKALHASR